MIFLIQILYYQRFFCFNSNQIVNFFLVLPRLLKVYFYYNQFYFSHNLNKKNFKLIILLVSNLQRYQNFEIKMLIYLIVEFNFKVFIKYFHILKVFIIFLVLNLTNLNFNLFYQYLYHNNCFYYYQMFMIFLHFLKTLKDKFD